jgi:hypothetical protein
MASASSAFLVTDRPQAHPKPGTGVTVIAGLMALWCIGFAVVNVVFETTGHFADGPYAEYASGFTVMNWFVVGLKVMGAAVALLSLANHPRFLTSALMTVAMWGVFATLAVYALGSVAQAVAMIAGLTGTADQVDVAGVGYVLLFLLAAAGFGVLAISYSRRHRVRKLFSVLGVLGAPMVLGLILLVGPTLLTALGVMPAP